MRRSYRCGSELPRSIGRFQPTSLEEVRDADGVLIGYHNRGLDAEIEAIVRSAPHSGPRDRSGRRLRARRAKWRAKKHRERMLEVQALLRLPLTPGELLRRAYHVEDL